MNKILELFFAWLASFLSQKTEPPVTPPPVVIKEPPVVVVEPAVIPAETSGHFIPRVADISHYEVITADGFKEAFQDGLGGVICKATQGTSYKDDKYDRFMHDAKAAGLLVGAYHFPTGDNPIAQVDHFLEVVKPDASTLVALDFESNPNGNSMSIQQAVVFLKEIEKRLGRKAVIYSGNDLKETIGDLNATDRAYVCSHRLWLAQYTSKPKLPIGFMRYWLWQYTGDGLGPTPHWVNGIKCPGSKGLDLNVYNGSPALFQKEWAS